MAGGGRARAEDGAAGGGAGGGAGGRAGAGGGGGGRAVTRPAARATQHPAAMLYGPGHLVVYGNPPFRALFGAGCIGLPAAEAFLDLPRAAFEMMDLVYREGRPLARWITVRGATWRLTIADRRDIGTGEVYGIALHLVPRERADSVG